jgi:hypothetical protein
MSYKLGQFTLRCKREVEANIIQDLFAFNIPLIIRLKTNNSTLALKKFLYLHTFFKTVQNCIL